MYKLWKNHLIETETPFKNHDSWPLWLINIYISRTTLLLTVNLKTIEPTFRFVFSNTHLETEPSMIEKRCRQKCVNQLVCYQRIHILVYQFTCKRKGPFLLKFVYVYKKTSRYSSQSRLVWVWMCPQSVGTYSNSKR